MVWCSGMNIVVKQLRPEVISQLSESFPRHCSSLNYQGLASIPHPETPLASADASIAETPFLGPGAQWHDIDLLLHIDEAGFLPV